MEPADERTNEEAVDDTLVTLAVVDSRSAEEVAGSCSTGLEEAGGNRSSDLGELVGGFDTSQLERARPP